MIRTYKTTRLPDGTIVVESHGPSSRGWRAARIVWAVIFIVAALVAAGGSVVNVRLRADRRRAHLADDAPPPYHVKVEGPFRCQTTAECGYHHADYNRNVSINQMLDYSIEAI